MAELELLIYDRSISVQEHRDLRRAIEASATEGDITWLTVLGKRETAIVPAELVEYAIRHGWQAPLAGLSSADDFHAHCPRCPGCKQHRHAGPCEVT